MLNAIKQANIDIPVIMSFLEDAIAQENLKLEANCILDNESEYLKSVRTIAEVKVFLSLLRGHVY